MKVQYHLLTVAVVVSLAAGSTLAAPFALDLNQPVNQQGFTVTGGEGSVTETPAGTHYQFYAAPGRNQVIYGSGPEGGAAGTAFQFRLTADIVGRGAYYFGVGNHMLSLSYDPIYGDIWIGVYRDDFSTLQTYIIDPSVTRTYEVQADAAGNWGLLIDSSPALSGTGWDNGDLMMMMNGDISFATYATPCNIYELNYLPEPATVGLLAVGGVAMLRRRRRR